MKNTLKWTGDMKFESVAGTNAVPMDANPPIGGGSAQTPKELVAAGLGGCTAMDVVALLKKHKQPFESLEVEVDVEMSKGGYPAVFTKGLLTFRASGAVDPKILLEAVHLSQTKYCGVSAMLVKAFPIEYAVILNREEIGRGRANFEEVQS
ncbi:MAG TPA: OsmC family protein [Pseudobdellovibrionaceae bacterium]|nr:OsmC family protein [Pseudobdellovibrionaceae bacterium]